MKLENLVLYILLTHTLSIEESASDVSEVRSTAEEKRLPNTFKIVLDVPALSTGFERGFRRPRLRKVRLPLFSDQLESPPPSPSLQRILERFTATHQSVPGAENVATERSFQNSAGKLMVQLEDLGESQTIEPSGVDFESQKSNTNETFNSSNSHNETAVQEYLEFIDKIGKNIFNKMKSTNRTYFNLVFDFFLGKISKNKLHLNDNKIDKITTHLKKYIKDNLKIPLLNKRSEVDDSEKFKNKHKQKNVIKIRSNDVDKAFNSSVTKYLKEAHFDKPSYAKNFVRLEKDYVNDTLNASKRNRYFNERHFNKPTRKANYAKNFKKLEKDFVNQTLNATKRAKFFNEQYFDRQSRKLRHTKRILNLTGGDVSQNMNDLITGQHFEWSSITPKAKMNLKFEIDSINQSKNASRRASNFHEYYFEMQSIGFKHIPREKIANKDQNKIGVNEDKLTVPYLPDNDRLSTSPQVLVDSSQYFTTSDYKLIHENTNYIGILESIPEQSISKSKQEKLSNSKIGNYKYTINLDKRTRHFDENQFDMPTIRSMPMKKNTLVPESSKNGNGVTFENKDIPNQSTKFTGEEITKINELKVTGSSYSSSIVSGLSTTVVNSYTINDDISYDVIKLKENNTFDLNGDSKTAADLTTNAEEVNSSKAEYKIGEIRTTSPRINDKDILYNESQENYLHLDITTNYQNYLDQEYEHNLHKEDFTEINTVLPLSHSNLSKVEMDADEKQVTKTENQDKIAAENKYIKSRNVSYMEDSRAPNKINITSIMNGQEEHAAAVTKNPIINLDFEKTFNDNIFEIKVTTPKIPLNVNDTIKENKTKLEYQFTKSLDKAIEGSTSNTPAYNGNNSSSLINYHKQLENTSNYGKFSEEYQYNHEFSLNDNEYFSGNELANQPELTHEESHNNTINENYTNFLNFLFRNKDKATKLNPQDETIDVNERNGFRINITEIDDDNQGEKHTTHSTEDEKLMGNRIYFKLNYGNDSLIDNTDFSESKNLFLIRDSKSNDFFILSSEDDTVSEETSKSNLYGKSTFSTKDEDMKRTLGKSQYQILYNLKDEPASDMNNIDGKDYHHGFNLEKNDENHHPPQPVLSRDYLFETPSLKGKQTLDNNLSSDVYSKPRNQRHSERLINNIDLRGSLGHGIKPSRSNENTDALVWKSNPPIRKEYDSFHSNRNTFAPGIDNPHSHGNSHASQGHNFQAKHNIKNLMGNIEPPHQNAFDLMLKNYGKNFHHHPNINMNDFQMQEINNHPSGIQSLHSTTNNHASQGQNFQAKQNIENFWKNDQTHQNDLDLFKNHGKDIHDQQKLRMKDIGMPKNHIYSHGILNTHNNIHKQASEGRDFEAKNNIGTFWKNDQIHQNNPDMLFKNHGKDIHDQQKLRVNDNGMPKNHIYSHNIQNTPNNIQKQASWGKDFEAKRNIENFWKNYQIQQNNTEMTFKNHGNDIHHKQKVNMNDIGMQENHIYPLGIQNPHDIYHNQASEGKDFQAKHNIGNFWKNIDQTHQNSIDLMFQNLGGSVPHQQKMNTNYIGIQENHRYPLSNSFPKSQAVQSGSTVVVPNNQQDTFKDKIENSNLENLKFIENVDKKFGQMKSEDGKTSALRSQSNLEESVAGQQRCNKYKVRRGKKQEGLRLLGAEGKYVIKIKQFEDCKVHIEDMWRSGSWDYEESCGLALVGISKCDDPLCCTCTVKKRESCSAQTNNGDLTAEENRFLQSFHRQLTGTISLETGTRCNQLKLRLKSYFRDRFLEIRDDLVCGTVNAQTTAVSNAATDKKKFEIFFLAKYLAKRKLCTVNVKISRGEDVCRYTSEEKLKPE